MMLGKKGNETMSIFDFDAFDEQFDSENLKKDLVDVENNTFERVEVPTGVYEVNVYKLELVASKTSGKPMATCWFKVLAGEYKGQMIFANYVLDNKFGLHRCNEFLRSLSDVPVQFDSFSQYGRLLIDIKGAIDGKFDYQLNYSKNAKGYSNYKIEKVFVAKQNTNTASSFNDEWVNEEAPF